MPLDAMAVRALTLELGGINGFKIDKIQQPEKDMLVLTLRGHGESRRLLISAGANPRVHLTDEKYENPAAPPMFCMLLRKNLAGGRITAVSQPGFERIINIDVECRTELGDVVTRRLVCELMGRGSNIIFLNEDGRVIDSVRHVDLGQSSARPILPGLPYLPPPDGGRLDPTEALAADYLKALSSADGGLYADKALTSAINGLSPLMARECVFSVCGDANIRVNEMTQNHIQKTAVAVEKLFARATDGDFSPCLLIKEAEGPEAAADFAAFAVRQYGGAMTVKPMKSMNAAAEEFYRLRDRQARMKAHASGMAKVINNCLARASRKLDLLQGDLAAAMDRDKYRVYGDLLTANLYAVERGAKSVTVTNYYDENQTQVTIPLDETKSPSQNAKSYYSKYKKAKNTELYAAEQIELTKNELAYLESVLLSLENARSLAELAEIREELTEGGYLKGEGGKRKKPARETASPPMSFSLMGYTVMVGRNNAQNDYLTLKLGRSRDLWLHTKNIAGSHTLVKYEGEDFPPEVISAAASLAAYFSKARGAPKAEVDYCPVSHVKKPRGAKAGMVIYEGYSTALVEPLPPEKLTDRKE